jgi:hypothetical protein
MNNLSLSARTSFSAVQRRFPAAEVIVVSIPAITVL